MPIDIMSTRAFRSKRKAITAEMTPAVIVAATGDCLLLTLARNLNSKPSRAMANRIRGKGNIEPRRLVDKAQREPAETTYLAGLHLTYSNATGSGLFSSRR